MNDGNLVKGVLDGLVLVVADLSADFDGALHTADHDLNAFVDEAFLIFGD